MKLSHASGATQDGQVMVERSDRMWSTGEGNGKPIHHSCLENHMDTMKRQNDRILKEELHRSVGAQYATEEEWTNSSRKNEEAVSSVQLLSHVQLFITQTIAVCRLPCLSPTPRD